MLQIQQELQKFANPAKAKILQGFFKTGKDQYGEGDVFLGVTVPETRRIAKKYTTLAFNAIETLLNSPVHEERLLALLILVEKYRKEEQAVKKQIYDFYLRNTAKINNWDLVDLSAHKIVGHYLSDKDKKMLYKLATSDNLWGRRIAIIGTFYFIKQNQFEDTLKIAAMLLKDKHDLIHKAVGWMLREIGKRNQEVEETFLQQHYKTMPRTMLRYAIEKFDDKKREFYLSKN